MNNKDMRVVIADDSILKAMDIRKALENAGVSDITIVRDQERLWEILCDENAVKQVNLIVTDMHYPVRTGEEALLDAGFKLIERLNVEKRDIPVIICSTINYNEPAILGCVWYNELNDIDGQFRELLKKI